MKNNITMYIGDNEWFKMQDHLQLPWVPFTQVGLGFGRLIYSPDQLTRYVFSHYEVMEVKPDEILTEAEAL